MKNIFITGLIIIVSVQLAVLVNNDGVIERQRGQVDRCVVTIRDLVDKVEELEAMEVFLRTNLDAEKANAVTLRGAIEELNQRLGYTPAPKKVVTAKTMVDLAAAAILKKDGPVAAAEFREAIEENIRPDMREDLAPIVAAIRHAENGAAGKEYGVLGEGVKRDMERRGATYRVQAGWCAATVQKTWDRYDAARETMPFEEYLGNRYCPVGAENDPTGLNVNWQRNVKTWYGIILGH